MHKQGAILLGNGGDNGNGSSGTFYEGVMTTGYPTEATTDAVQANIVAAKYDVRAGEPVAGHDVHPGIVAGRHRDVHEHHGRARDGRQVERFRAHGVDRRGFGHHRDVEDVRWPGRAGRERERDFQGHLAGDDRRRLPDRQGRVDEPGSRRHAIRDNYRSGCGTSSRSRSTRSASAPAPTRPTSSSSSTTPPPAAVDLSNWTLINTQSQWAPVKLATIPAGTKLAGHGFYLLGLSSSGLAAPASPGATTINVRSTTGFEAGQKIDIDGETRTIASVGTPAAAMTTVFVPVSTGPWLTIPAGSTNLPVTSAAGFEVGQKIGIDIGGNYELATVTAVGKAATQTTLRRRRTRARPTSRSRPTPT